MAGDHGRVEGFFHAVVTVADMETSLAFYRDLLGMRVSYAWEHDPGTLRALTGYPDPQAAAAVLECPDGTEIELVEFRRPLGLERVEKRWHDAGLSFAAFKVTGIEGLVDRLLRAGVRFNGDVVHQRLDDGAVVKVVYCFAPEGTSITLVELPPARQTLAPPEGGACAPRRGVIPVESAGLGTGPPHGAHPHPAHGPLPVRRSLCCPGPCRGASG